MSLRLSLSLKLIWSVCKLRYISQFNAAVTGMLNIHFGCSTCVELHLIWILPINKINDTYHDTNPWYSWYKSWYTSMILLIHVMIQIYDTHDTCHDTNLWYSYKSWYTSMILMIQIMLQIHDTHDTRHDTPPWYSWYTSLIHIHEWMNMAHHFNGDDCSIKKTVFLCLRAARVPIGGTSELIYYPLYPQRSSGEKEID